MKPIVIGHTLAILASTLIPWLWFQDPSLSPYTLQLAGVTTILYTATRFFLRQTNRENSEGILSLVFINSLAQLLILTTGKESSPIFSLLYLILFAVALLFEPYQAAIISITTSLLILIPNYSNPSFESITTIIELIMVTPLAVIFSQSYLKNLQSKGRVKLLEQELEQEETDELLWITTTAKPTLSTIINSLSEVQIFLNSTRHNLSLPKNLLDKMRHIQADLITLYSSTENLKSTLEEESGNNNI